MLGEASSILGAVLSTKGRACGPCSRAGPLKRVVRSRCRPSKSNRVGLVLGAPIYGVFGHDI